MNRKLLLSLFVAAVFSVSFNAQRYELGIRGGMSNLVGDIGKTNYILQAPMGDMSQFGLPGYAGLIYRMNFNPHQTLRFDVGYNHVQFDDKKAKEEYRRNRKMWGTNNILEADAIFEYAFFPVNNEQESMLSPYIFGGISGLYADVTQANLVNDFRRDNTGVAQAPMNELDFVTKVEYSSGKKLTMAIPFGVGLKYKFNRNWGLFAEVMFRPTITDQLDYSTIETKDIKTTYNTDILDPVSGKSLLQSSPYYNVSKDREAAFIKERQVGDPNTKDWLNTVSLGLTYSFGRPPCYCE